jgi:SHS2 domain-containing protein
LFSSNIIKILNEWKRFKRLWKIYSFTNENIKSYFWQFSFDSKRVLTVTASWDHALNAFYSWAESVECFDINIISRLYVELKFEALKLLSFSEFKNFFFIWWDNPFSYEIYQRISLNLSIIWKYFFDSLYECFWYDWKKIRYSDLFNKNTDLDERKIENNYYLESEKNYLTTREKIFGKTVYFFDSDIYDLSKLLENREYYDLIFTSNISDYLHQHHSNENYLMEYKMKVFLPFLKKIKHWWALIFAYLNDTTNPIQLSRNLMYSDVEREKVFKENWYWEYVFNSSNLCFDWVIDKIIYVIKHYE